MEELDKITNDIKEKYVCRNIKLEYQVFQSHKWISEFTVEILKIEMMMILDSGLQGEIFNVFLAFTKRNSISLITYYLKESC